MKAALLTAINQPLEICDLEPCALQFGQVLVRVVASGICGAQLQEIRGEKGNHFPRLMGHEGCGIVEAIGPGVKTVKVGDKVVCHWRKGDGSESDTPRYLLNGGEITGGQVATFATHSICSENRLTAVPDDAPVDLCALLGCGLSTALGTIEHEANLKMGESVLVIGCGGLGLNLIRAARMRKAGAIVGCDIFESKGSSAVSAGADAFVDTCAYEIGDDGGLAYTKQSRVVGNYDVVIDTTGNPEAIGDGLKLVGPSGRFIMVGQPHGSVTIANGRAMFDGDGKSIKATQGGGFRPSLDIPRYYQLWKSGQLDLSGIITARLPLDRINDGLDMVRRGEAGRVLIEMS